MVLAAVERQALESAGPVLGAQRRTALVMETVAGRAHAIAATSHLIVGRLWISTLELVHGLHHGRSVWYSTWPRGTAKGTVGAVRGIVGSWRYAICGRAHNGLLVERRMAVGRSDDSLAGILGLGRKCRPLLACCCRVLSAFLTAATNTHSPRADAAWCLQAKSRVRE